jgi:hypothetical protein
MRDGRTQRWAIVLSLAFAATNQGGVALASAAGVDRRVGSVLAAHSPVVSVSPVRLGAPDRGQDLHVRVSAPVNGRDLPIIVFAHGNGLSSDAYAPLANFWAAHGFVVIQPTFLDSRTTGLPRGDPRAPLIWRFRVADMKRVLDQLDSIEAAVPGLRGRLDRSRIAAAGHSYGGITTGMLLGARVLDPDGREGEDLSDPRIKAGILLSTAGHGGKDLSAFAAEHFPFMNPSFARMSRPVLVVMGDKDLSKLSVRGPDWYADPYHLSPGSKCLLTLFGAEHMLGGISGTGLAETTDENPDRVALVQQLTWAYLRSALYPKDPAWAAVRASMQDLNTLGRIECK